jgi:hypothetical protein
MAEERVFKSVNKDGKEVDIKFNSLSQVVLSRGDFIYREYFSKAMRAGVMTNAEALKILKDREIWGDEQEKEVINLQVKLGELERLLKEKDKKDSTSLSIYNEIKEIRKDLEAASDVRGNVLNNTAESMAAEMRTQFFASECVVYNTTGEKVFDGLKDFLSRLDDKVTTDCYRQALIMNYERALGIVLPTDLAPSVLPEDEWLNALNFKLEEPIAPRLEKVRKSRKKTATAK